MANYREGIRNAALAPLMIVWVLAAPITFILNVVHTWQGSAAVWLKLLINVTLDAFLASIWPITWMLWLVYRSFGRNTPLDLLF